MNDKQQIEDLTNIIDSFNIRTYANAQAVAKFLVEKYGYRKIPENAVVLTREQMCEIVSNHNQINKDMVKQARNETAREFAKRVKERIRFLKTLFHATGEGEYNGIEPNEINELAKQFGVEIKG